MNIMNNMSKMTDATDKQGAQNDSSEELDKDAVIAKLRKQVTISLICFICVLISTIVVAVNHIQNGSADNAFILVIGIFMLVIPIVVSFVADCKAMKQIIDCKSEGILVPQGMETLAGILALQIPLFLLILIGSSMIKPAIAAHRVEAFISARYSDYTILESCHHFDESIQDYTKIIFEMDGLSKPVTAKYDWRSQTYEDNYEDVKAGTAVQGSEYCS